MELWNFFTQVLQADISKGPPSFMTWNLYLGADVTPLFTATPQQIPQRVTEVFRQFLATQFSCPCEGDCQSDYFEETRYHRTARSRTSGNCLFRICRQSHTTL